MQYRFFYSMLTSACLGLTLAPSALAQVSQEVMCDGETVDVERWRHLIDFEPAERAVESVERRSAFFGLANGYIQDIEEHGTGEVNLDYYALRIREMPSASDPGLPDVEPGDPAEEFLELFRTNLDSFLPESHAAFDEHESADAEKWTSDDPVGAVMVFQMRVWDELTDWVQPRGAVVASEYTPTSWVFSTAYLPDVSIGLHPVSGNREFGIKETSDGYVLYIQAADRITDLMIPLPSFYSDLVFGGGHELWATLMDDMADYINSNGGRAEVAEDEVVSVRCPWDSVAPAEVEVVAPVANEILRVGEEVLVEANINDIVGEVSSVEFFADDMSVGIDFSAPYETNWTPSSGGEVMLTAHVTNTQGATTVSAGIPVEVREFDVVCEYLSHEWVDGFVGRVKITNEGADPVEGWEVTLDYPEGVEITHEWGAEFSGSDPVVATSKVWNNIIRPGRTKQFGFTASKAMPGSPAPVPELGGETCEN